jgi:hypothetical protein
VSSVVIPDLFSLNSVIDYLVAHRDQFPEHGEYNIEMRNCLLAKPPQHLTHDDQTRTVILIGVSV